MRIPKCTAQQLVGGVWSTIRTVGATARFQSINGLTPATAYTFAVIAFDARGNTSEAVMNHTLLGRRPG